MGLSPDLIRGEQRASISSKLPPRPQPVSHAPARMVTLGGWISEPLTLTTDSLSSHPSGQGQPFQEGHPKLRGWA